MLWSWILPLFAAAPALGSGEEFFKAQVAGILETRCVRCHDENARKSGLSLATRAGAFAGGKRGAAIVPGKPGESLLLAMVSGEKPKMPKQADPLESGQVDALRRWIAEGAAWPESTVLTAKDGGEGTWWSLRPIAKPAVPVLPALPALKPPWGTTPIDAFILAKLEEKGLEPSPAADRRTLIRRLTFDLHGLPPAPGEVEAFERDDEPGAYEKLVDRLLDSPRYGERWARHWLDVVHYGESHGYDKDKRRPNAWPYRDYVIRSFNADKPYARFVEEQLAGDVLFLDDPDGIVATGFIAAGPWDFVGHVELREGTVDKAIARSNDRDDMVAATMSTFASVTAHCARCHDHKFDPIPQEDYYSLQSVFAGVDRADRPYDTDPETHRARRVLTAEKKTLDAKLKSFNDVAAAVTSPEIKNLDEKIAVLEKELAALPAAGSSPSNGYHSEIISGPDATKWVEVDLGRAVPIDQIVLVPARPTDFPDTPGFGFPLRFRIEASDEPIAAARPRHVLADHTAADFPNPGDAPFTVQGAGKTARFVRVTATRLWKRTGDHVFALGELQVLVGGKNVALGVTVNALDSIEAGRWGKARLVDGFSSREQLGAGADPPKNTAQRSRLQADVTRAREDRQALVSSLLDGATRRGLADAAASLAEVDQRLARLPTPRLVFAAASDFARNGSFGPASTPRPVHLLHRGDVKSPGELMSPGALSCLQDLEARFELDNPAGEGQRRAALARWIVDPRNALAWRSIVNRVWHYHFGRGLVDTPNDFGRMGSKPTHPELLDWLASWFLEKGGSLKKLHRLILTSAVYRQSSRHDEASAKIDADNRWLWRMSRARLEAEAVRDAILAASGKLDLAMGGPSVDHFLFKDDHSPVYDYMRFDVDDPAGLRRSVYRFIVRSVPDPFMDCLDCADPSILTPKRNNTLTALQALAMLNTPFTVRQSEHFAARLRKVNKDPERQIDAAYRLALGRAPAGEDVRLLAAHASRYGLENACRLILNSNEFLFID